MGRRQDFDAAMQLAENCRDEAIRLHEERKTALEERAAAESQLLVLESPPVAEAHLVEEAKRKVSEARAAHRAKRTEHRDAKRAAAEAREAAAVLGERALSFACWLGWDGVHSAAGKANGAYPASGRRRRVARRAEHFETVVGAARLRSQQKSDLSARLDRRPIAVRVTQTNRSFHPLRERMTAKLEIDGIERVRSLLFRVLDAHDAVLYQEVLDADGIAKLPLTPESAAAHHAPLLERLYACAGHAGQEGEENCVARAWVSTRGDAFDGLALDEDPDEVADRTVADVSTAGRGTNLSKARGARILSSVLLVEDTNHDEAVHGRSVESKIAAIRTAITWANGLFGAEPCEREVRLFVGPEWFFSAEPSPWAMSEADKDDVIDRLERLSGEAACADWLLFPGTILWSLPVSPEDVGFTLNTMACVAGGATEHLYHKRRWGSDTPFGGIFRKENIVEITDARVDEWSGTLDHRTFPEELRVAMWGYPVSWIPRSGTTTKVRRLVRGARWDVEVRQGTDRKHVIVRRVGGSLHIQPAACFGNGLGVPDWTIHGHTHADYATTSLFRYEGLKVALEICADHQGAMAARDARARAGTWPRGTDVHVISSANVDLTPLRVVSREGGLVLHCDGAGKGQAAAEVTGRANHTITDIATTQTARDTEAEATGAPHTAYGATWATTLALTASDALTACEEAQLGPTVKVKLHRFVLNDR